MIEKVDMRVCDLEDGKPAVTAINWNGGQGTVQNDLCADHASILAKNGHRPRRGRQPGTVIKPQARKTRKKATTTRKRTTRKKR
jgi:hypothetical protein